MTHAQALHHIFLRHGQPTDGDTFCKWVASLDREACVAKTGPCELVVLFSDRSIIEFDTRSLLDCGTIVSVH